MFLGKPFLGSSSFILATLLGCCLLPYHFRLWHRVVVAFCMWVVSFGISTKGEHVSPPVGTQPNMVSRDIGLGKGVDRFCAAFRTAQSQHIPGRQEGLPCTRRGSPQVLCGPSLTRNARACKKEGRHPGQLSVMGDWI